MGRAQAIILALSFAFPVWAQHSPEASQPYHAEPSSRPTSGQSSSMLSGSEIFSRAHASVVVIFAASQDGKRQVLGSGFVVGHDRIATNHHVLAGMDKAYVVFSDGDIRSVSGVVADSPQQDLLILAVETADRSPLALGDELSLQQGDLVYALGAPQGLELSLTNGIVSAFRNSDGQFLIQTTAPIAHGSSGGPLIDRAGRVVGITTSMLSDASGIYFSIGIGDLKRLLRTPQLVLLPLDQWVKQNPDQPTDVSGGKTSDPKEIEALLAKKKFDEARTAIQLLAEKNPDAAVVHRLEGELLSRTGDLDSALTEFTISVKQDPNDTLAHFYYAIALFEARRFQEALTEEQTSYRLSPGAGDQPLLALLYYANHDYRQAEPMARATLDTDPNNENAVNVLTGIVYHGASSYIRIQDSQGKIWDVPQSNLDAARRADPNLQVLNSAQTLSGWVQEAARVNADDFWVHITNANEATKQNEPDRAVAEYAAAEKDDFPDAAAYLGSTYLYLRASQIGPARDQIRLGLTAVPEDAQLLNEGMFVALLARDNTEAKRRFDDIERFYPNSGSALSSGCLYYYGTLQSTNALSYCERLTNEFPSDHTSHSNYGWAALDANQFQLALREFSKAYQLVSSNWNQLTDVQIVDLMWGFTLADYYSGDKKQARKLFEIIRKQYPNAATVTGLQQMPLLWSSTTMSRIETVLREYPK